MSTTLEELVKRLEKLESEIASLKGMRGIQTVDEKQRREVGEAILKLGEQIGMKLRGSNVSLSDIVLQNRAEW
ncbi:hypothetical protein GG496_000247 [Candidatus Fervidibacteria bacterium JGI MDM2 JNZ-1-D12]